MKLYETIRKLRLRNGYTQESLAEALGVNPQAVKGWESRNPEKRSLPRLEHMLAMCGLFGCDLDYLTGRIRERTHDIRTAGEVTGLSEEAVEKLRGMARFGYSGALSHMIETQHFAQFISAYTSFLRLAGNLRDEEPEMPGESCRQRADGKIIMSGSEAVHHYMSRASSALMSICGEDCGGRTERNRKAKEPEDMEEELLREIGAAEQDLRCLEAFREYLAGGGGIGA